MPDAVMQTSTLANISTTAGVNFDGVAANDSAPAGTTQFVEWVNTELAVYDKTGKLLLGSVAGNTLWSGFGRPCQTNNEGGFDEK